MRKGRIFLSVLLVLSLLVSGLGGVFGSLPQAQAASTTMVISEVVTGSSASTGASDEYVELFNASASPVDLNGWFLKYCGGATGGTGVTPAWTVSVSWTVSTVVPAYGHFLVKGSAYSGAAWDAVLGGGISEIGAASIWNGTTQVDALGWGLMTGHLERAGGGTPVAAAGLTRNQVIERKPGYPNWNGEDTDNNVADFMVSTSSDGSARHPQTLADAITPPVGSSSVPGSPTSLAATDGLGQISLAWSAPANDGGAGTVEYNVYRAADSSMGGMTILNSSLLSTTSYVNDGLGAGAHYWYTVTAHNSIGDGAASSAVEGWTFDVPPAVVSTVAVEGDGRVDLTWNASVGDPQHLSVVSYNVWRGTSAGGEDIVTPINGTPVSGLSFSDTTAVNGTTYFYRVTAVNEVGQTGVPSGNEVHATPHILITAPIITNLVPADQAFIADVRPHISAEYGDTGSAIDVTSVKLLVDGIDVTSQAVVTASSVNYAPVIDLTKSLHSVQLDVANSAPTPVSTQVIWTFTVGNYNIYFGGMHSHTNLSDGTGTPQQAYDSAKAAGADFMAVTDHSNWFDGDSATVVANLAGGPSTEWATLKAAADANNVPGTFVGIAGFEMTWSGGPGHINTFNTVGYDTRTHTAMTLTAYYAQLALYPQSISQLNHPGTTFGTFDDFAHWTAEADAVVNLVEVGNGEGVVHQAGYFPSYQYYQMALDKGWHVAPSNNQDNHKGNWMSANDARTVVLAPTLTRNAIYEAIRQKHVYATEDKDLRVTYFLNGAVMGSSLDNPSTLDFSITFGDAETTDIITKVSVIANGGVVVASTNPNTSQGTWNFTMPTDPYSFYYVRIDQADTDVAVTAPVWTGDVVKVGVSKVEASQDPQIVGIPVDFTATAYNNGSVGVTNATMEFFKDTIVPENKLGEVTALSIPASGTTTAKITWTPTTAGTWTIYARLTATVGSEVETSFASTTFTAANPDEVTQVVIDGGHSNAYTTGYYAGNMKTLTAMIKAQKMMPVITVVDHQLTAADLQYAKILILNDPQSKPLPKNYSPAEIQVIKDFVDAGGSLILTSRADYDEKGVSDPTAHSAYQGNVVLDAIGSNLRLNDDEVIDDTSNGGQNYRLYFDDYTGSKYHLTDGIPVGRTYSFYSGCSVILKSGGSEANVDWLVKGHPTTASLDSDLAGDATPVAMGNVYGLAAEILPGGGKVVVGGTAFFSDFETASADNAYSNKQIINNIINWALLKTIAETRVDANTDGSPDLFGNRVTVEGRVTAQSKAVGPNTAFFDVIYVQDATGGLDVFGISTSVIPLGTLVRVTGIVGQYEGDSQIHVLSESDDILMIDSTPALVSPLSMSTGASMLETSEGWLVKVEGVVTSIVTTGGDNSVYINDGTGVAKVYVNGYVGDGTDNPAMLGAWDPAITVGDWVSAIGLASQDAAGHRLRVRNTAEIVRASRASYTLAYTAGVNGTVTGTSPQTVGYGASGTTVTAVPNAGYHFVSWSDTSTTNPRTDTNVTVDVNVTAIFSSAIDTFTIAASAGDHGSISPSGDTTIDYGGSQAYTISPTSLGYHVADVLVDNVSAGAVTTYTFTNVTVAHTITATFTTAIDTFTLTYTAGANGTITGTSPQTVGYGASGTLVTAVPNAGYHFLSWSDGILTAARTDTNVTANKTVTATFTTVIDAYTITVESGHNGRILPGSGRISRHATRVFNIRADKGYVIDSVIVDGAPLVDAVNKRSYVVTFKKVEGPHTIATTFKPGH